jgi:hypothetical protein
MDDPFKKMMTELRDEILSGVQDLLKEQRVRGAGSSDLDPFELYDSTGAAEFLGIDRSTLYDIPETELPRCRVGPARGSTRWMGADLLAYARGLDPIDYKSVLDELREELRRRPGTTADRTDESKRVL